MKLPSARPATVEMLRADLAAERHPSDGGGRAWLDCPPGVGGCGVVAGRPGRWTVLYEAGPAGIAQGGWLFLQASPFWGWSPPQTEAPRAPGYTTVESLAEGVELRPMAAGDGLLAIEIAGRALRQGERVRMVYGAGERGAVGDRYAESGSPLWVAVDGDGDGVRRLLPEPPRIDVRAAAPAQIIATLPATARPGDRVTLTVALLDRVGNAGFPFEGEVVLAAPSGGLTLPDRVVFAAADRGARRVAVEVAGAGVHRVVAGAAAGERELVAESNPMLVADAVPTLLWGDLHGHSRFSDGSATPEEYFRYARDVAALDVVALTDHDHWGMRPLVETPEMWQEIRRQVAAFHAPGSFITLLGYEWTNWLHGHRHVLYFTDEGELLSSVDPAYETPAQLWRALRGKPAMTFAHHSAGGPVATNWDYPPDPELEPVTEVVSVHGASEAPDAPAAIYSPVAGNFVRDVLERGYRLGFIGSGDSHDGHPGLAHLAAPSGGLAAIFADEVSRGGVRAARAARRVYATNGPRILLLARLAGARMGSTLAPADVADGAELTLMVIGTAPLGRLDLVRSGGIVESLDAGGERRFDLSATIEGLTAGDFLYLRVVQEDGGAAWSSPFFIAP